ncbi:MAG: citramalate synthase [Candidatus Binatia bacterium]
MRRIHLYDTTLRDGCQSEDVAFTLDDKLRIVERLDDLGIHYVEGGWPGSNPRDEEFFRAVRRLTLRHAKVAAFGATRRAGVRTDQDRNLALCLEAATPVVTLVGKTWDLHVREDLRIPLTENLDVIHESIAYAKHRTDAVVFDAEHFFDGWKANPEYALRCLEAAAAAGADVLCLCETRGGALPTEVAAAVDAARAALPDVALGIHCHNDCDLAVANSLIAVEHGCTQVQGTINGIGERCGNANLVSVVPVLQLKRGWHCLTAAQLRHLAEVSRYVYALANMEPNKRQPFVGQSAFAHKGGLHVAAVQKNAATYEHMDPALVGNTQRVLVSDLAGRSNVLVKAREFGVDLEGNSPAIQRLLRELKELEAQGYAYEGAEASFELLMRKALDGDRVRFFRLIGFRVIDEKRHEGEAPIAEATIMLEGPDGRVEHTAAQGNGPVNALDGALRKALAKFYPEVEQVRLHDYKVRVLGGAEGTAAVVRVLIESGDDEERWGTVGVSHNVIEASWQALVDSMDYKLHKQRRAGGRRRRAGAHPA